MMFARNTVYRHESTLDIDLYVLSSESLASGDIKAKVLYLNRQYGHQLAHRKPDEVVIRESDFGLWKQIYI